MTQMDGLPTNASTSSLPFPPLPFWMGVAIPDQQGVLHVGGRAGAAKGPAALRTVFDRFKSAASVGKACRGWEVVKGLTQDIEENHRLAIETITKAVSQAPVSVIVGGGHDHGYTHLEGLRRHLEARLGRPPRLGCINLDAHLDVRKPSPAITSGSPFYLALENGTLRPEDLVEFGIQTQSNAPELWEYVSARGVPVVRFHELRDADIPARFAEELRTLEARCDAVAISLDLDCVDQAHAPGVSAPQSEGFTPRELFTMLRTAGASSKVISLGVFELNPEHDLDQRTARLGATAVHHFLEAKTP